MCATGSTFSHLPLPLSFTSPPPPPPSLSLSFSAACYDSINHCVWTSNDDWVDVWDCCGKVRPAVHLLASRLGKSSTQELIPDTDNSQKTVEGVNIDQITYLGYLLLIISLRGNKVAPEAYWDRILSAVSWGGDEGCGLSQPPAVLPGEGV